MSLLDTATVFTCGCIWDWHQSGWDAVCFEHRNRELFCSCLNSGRDDGATTCFTHHNCQWGDCTHIDED